MSIRRVVTGFDTGGTATVLFDGPAPGAMDLPPEAGSVVDLWRSDAVPLDTTTTDDPTDGAGFVLMPPGSLFRVMEMPPGSDRPFWHTTPTVDFTYIAAGEATLLLGDEGNVTHEITLQTGDTLVHRGPHHAWVNRGSEVCRLISACVAASLPPDVQPR